MVMSLFGQQHLYLKDSREKEGIKKKRERPVYSGRYFIERSEFNNP